MSGITNEQIGLWIILPVGSILLYLLAHDDEDKAEEQLEQKRDLTKESEFLEYNKENMYGNMLAAEEHLRKLTGKKIDTTKGDASCVIKHLLIAENHHGMEAISHSADLKEGASEDFSRVSDSLRNIRIKLQNGQIDSTQAICELRTTRRDFESFNPTFNISHCKACKLE